MNRFRTLAEKLHGCLAPLLKYYIMHNFPCWVNKVGFLPWKKNICWCFNKNKFSQKRQILTISKELTLWRRNPLTIPLRKQRKKSHKLHSFICMNQCRTPWRTMNRNTHLLKPDIPFTEARGSFSSIEPGFLM